LSDVQLIPPCDRILLEMTYSDLYKWAIKELRTALIQADMKFKSRGINPAIPPVDTTKVLRITNFTPDLKERGDYCFTIILCVCVHNKSYP
jgi:hypothetical protein